MSDTTNKMRSMIELTIKRLEGLTLILDNADLIIDALSKQRRFLDKPIVIKEPAVPQNCDSKQKVDNLTNSQESPIEVKSEPKPAGKKRGRKPKAKPVDVEPKESKKRGRKVKTEGVVTMPDGSTLAYHSLEERKLAWKIYADIYRKQRRDDKKAKKELMERQREEHIRRALTVPSTEDHVRWLKEHLEEFHELVRAYPGGFRLAVEEFFGFNENDEQELVNVVCHIINNLEDFGLTRNELSNIIVKEQP